MEQGIYTLKINESYKRLISPLSPEELQQLEQNIIRDGCREPIFVWNNMILDGHNRYDICTRLKIPFAIQHILLRNNEEAIAWICANQLGRRNITHETRKYLIGKRYEMEKMIGAHNTAGRNQHTKKEVSLKVLNRPTFDETAFRTSERLGKEYHISYGTVLKYGKYSNALDTLAEAIPELVPKILSGDIKISQENVVDMSKLSQQDILRLNKSITDNNIESVSFSNMRKVLPKRMYTMKKPPLSIPAGSVKDMPILDPDAEISSLTLTVPSWVSSIFRTHSQSKLGAISSNARHKLEKELLILKETIDSMLEAIREET